MDIFGAKFVQADEVVDRLTAGLDAKGCVTVADVETLPINGTEADGKLFWIHLKMI